MIKNWKKFTAVDDTPADGKTARAISSNWAYDRAVLDTAHAADLAAHTQSFYSIPTVGNYYLGGLFYRGASSKVAPGVNVIAFMPYTVPRAMTFDRIATHVGTAGTSGALLRIGVYSTANTWVPVTLLLDSGEIDVTGATIQEVTISGNLSLAKGNYMTCLLGNNATTSLYMALAGAGFMGNKNDFTDVVPRSRTKAHTYAALPTSPPTSGFGDGAYGWLIGLRVLSLD